MESSQVVFFDHFVSVFQVSCSVFYQRDGGESFKKHWEVIELDIFLKIGVWLHPASPTPPPQYKEVGVQ